LKFAAGSVGLGAMRIALSCLLLAAVACDKKTDAQPEPVKSAAPSATAKQEPPPGPCKSGTKPTELGHARGYVYGFDLDASHVYFSTWQVYGGRGDLKAVRKDGVGQKHLASLSLEPRGLVVDDKHVYFTSGIRLMQVPKSGGDQKVAAPQFSSQSIAGDGRFIYGVPGDYGPYDRLIRMEKRSGKTKELDVSERPEAEHAPFGFSAIAVDSENIFATDSSANRVLRFGLDRGKPKVLATKQDKAYELALDDESVYFTLAQKGQLMKVPKKGGTPQKVAQGLAVRARIAVDDKGIVTNTGDDEELPQTLVRMDTDGSDPAPLATVPRGHSVEAVGLDDACVYWAQRNTESEEIRLYARAR
jgi:hypothetical protein